MYNLTEQQIKEVEATMKYENISLEEAITEVKAREVRELKCKENRELAEQIVKQYNADYLIEYSYCTETIYFRLFKENNFDYYEVNIKAKVDNIKTSVDLACSILKQVEQDLSGFKYKKATQNEIVLRTLEFAYVNTIAVLLDSKTLFVEDCDFCISDITNIRIKKDKLIFDYIDDEDEAKITYTVDLRTGILG